jgi:hypothetical protein
VLPLSGVAAGAGVADVEVPPTLPPVAGAPAPGVVVVVIGAGVALSGAPGADVPLAGGVDCGGAEALDTNAGSESGGTGGRALQNQPMIWVPEQVRVPEPES